MTLVDTILVGVSHLALLPPLLVGFGSSGQAGYQISRSLRFRGAQQLNYTTSFALTSATTGTLSMWLKVSEFTKARNLFYFGATGGAGNLVVMSLNSGDQLSIVFNGGATASWTSTQVFRDPSAHLHIVFGVDTTQATAANRVTVEINGVVAAGSFTAMAQNAAFSWGSGNLFGLGQSIGSSNLFTGYMSEVYWIDGQKLAASNFGQFDAVTGVWSPMAYTGTFGLAGGYWNFSDNSAATAAAIGKDRSGNGHDLTPTGVSVAADATNDSLVETPTNYGTDAGAGGQARGNYCTWNPIWPSASAPANGNLDSPTAGVARGTQALLQFDAYWEITSTGGTSTAGVVSDGGTTNTTTVANGKTYGFRLTAAGSLDFINITDAGAWTGIATGLIGIQYPYTSGAASTIATINAGQRAFAATAPSGFKALCTQNMPAPTIALPGNYFNVLLHTGTGASLDVTGAAFQPDLAWIKSRSGTFSNALFDSSRGVENRLLTDATTAETVVTGGVAAFLTNGITVGADSVDGAGGSTYVDWLWKKGAIPGFDIQTYTGTGAAHTISHALGASPSLIIVKRRDAVASGSVYHNSIPVADILVLDATNAQTADSTNFNATAPTASVFSVGTAVRANASGGTYVAYLWAEIPGFSKFGSYTGNGIADGPLVWCGFRPRWVVIKRTDAASSWVIFDTSRDPSNAADSFLEVDSSQAESSSGGLLLDFVSNGFKPRQTGTAINTSGGNYVFAAFAESAFKFSRAR